MEELEYERAKKEKYLKGAQSIYSSFDSSFEVPQRKISRLNRSWPSNDRSAVLDLEVQAIRLWPRVHNFEEVPKGAPSNGIGANRTY